MLFEIDSGKVCFDGVNRSERKSQNLSVKGARVVTPKVVDARIAFVEKLFQESGQCGHVSKDFSNRLWNCDETAFSISGASKKVLAKRGSHEEGT